MKTSVVGTRQNCLTEVILMSTHNIFFFMEKQRKLPFNYHQIPTLSDSLQDMEHSSILKGKSGHFIVTSLDNKYIYWWKELSAISYSLYIKSKQKQ